MITIGICDDEEIHRNYIKELCEHFFINYPQEHKYIEFASGEDVLVYKDDKLHLLFLDVEMKGINGIEVLRRVEDADWIWRIVFVSSHPDAVWDSFSIKTLEFARKPIQYQQVEKWIGIALRENEENIIYEFDAVSGRMYKSIEEIFYLEAARNYTCLYGKDDKWLINSNLKNWENRMEGAPLLRIHKSYLVNMVHIKTWQAEKVVLDNKMEIPIGRQFSKTAREIYYAYIKKQALRRV